MCSISKVIILFVALSASAVYARPGYAVDYYVSVIWRIRKKISEFKDNNIIRIRKGQGFLKCLYLKNNEWNLLNENMEKSSDL